VMACETRVRGLRTRPFPLAVPAVVRAALCPCRLCRNESVTGRPPQPSPRPARDPSAPPRRCPPHRGTHTRKRLGSPTRPQHGWKQTPVQTFPRSVSWRSGRTRWDRLGSYTRGGSHLLIAPSMVQDIRSHVGRLGCGLFRADQQGPSNDCGLRVRALWKEAVCRCGRLIRRRRPSTSVCTLTARRAVQWVATVAVALAGSAVKLTADILTVAAGARQAARICAATVAVVPAGYAGRLTADFWRFVGAEGLGAPSRTATTLATA
jgi:hypothetical protein